MTRLAGSERPGARARRGAREPRDRRRRRLRAPRGLTPAVALPGARADRAARSTTGRGCCASIRVVGAPGEFRPLVLDEAGRLYLYRYWDYEKRLADDLLARAHDADDVDEALLREGLERYFPRRARRRAEARRGDRGAAPLLRDLGRTGHRQDDDGRENPRAARGAGARAPARDRRSRRRPARPRRACRRRCARRSNRSTSISSRAR